MLQEKLQTDLIKAMKSANTIEKEVLSFLLSKIKNKSIELRSQETYISDVEVIIIIQKMIKELDEEFKMYQGVGRTETAALKEKQILILNTYLPRMLTEDEIKHEINMLEDKSIPSIMKHFKINFAGSVDMGLVSKIAREIK